MAIDPASLTLPVKMKLNTNVSTLPVIRQLTALAIDRGWESSVRTDIGTSNHHNASSCVFIEAHGQWRYAVVPVPEQAPSYLPGLALMATTPTNVEQEGGVSPKIATPRLRGAEPRDMGNAQPMRGLGLRKLDGWDWPSSIMTFDGNPKPVQFIQPNVLDRASLSVGKHDGFADQFGLRRTVLIQNFWRMALHRWHSSSMFGRAVCAVQSGSTAMLVPTLSRWNDWWWRLLQFAEPVELRSKAPRAFRLFFQDRAQPLPDLLNDCSAVFGVYVNAVAHNEASFG
jgi:hypothetical protein